MRRKTLSLLLKHRLAFPAKRSIPQLAKEIRVDARTLLRIIDQMGQPNRNTLEKIAIFLKMPIQEIRRRPGFPSAAKRLSLTSHRAKLWLSTTDQEECELLRFMKSGRAYAVCDSSSSQKDLDTAVCRNVTSIFDGHRKPQVFVTTGDQNERDKLNIFESFPVNPHAFIYFGTRISSGRLNYREKEALRAAVLGIIRSGWSCLNLFPSPFTLISHIFACWQDKSLMPLPENCMVFSQKIEYYSHLISNSFHETISRNVSYPSIDFIFCIKRLFSELEKFPIGNDDCKNEIHNSEMTDVITTTLKGYISNFIGSEIFDSNYEYIILKFQNDHDTFNRLSSLVIVGFFKLLNGSCKIFPNISEIDGTIALEMSVGSILLLINNEGTRKYAKRILESLYLFTRLKNPG